MTVPAVTPRRRPAKPGHRYTDVLSNTSGGLFVACRDCGGPVFDTPADQLAHDRLHARLDNLEARLAQLGHDNGTTR